MARKRGGHGGGHGWFVTFADLMGLMMSFFVMLVAFSTMDNEKLKVVAGSMRDAFGVQSAARYSGVIESDGNLLVIGSAQHADASVHGVFLQLDASGQPDPGFGVDGGVELSLTSDGLGYTGISAVARQGADLVFSANVLEPADAYFHQYLVRAAGDSASAPPPARGHSHHRHAAP